MNGGDKMEFIGVGGNEGVFVEELDVIDGKFEVFGVVGGERGQEIEFCEFS